MTSPGTRPLVCTMLLVAFLLSSPAAAVKINVTPDTWIDLHLLIQPTAQLRYEPSAPPTFKPDFFVRRTRFVLGGQITRWVSFFAETDMPDWGKGGDWTAASFFVQDAYLSVNLHRGFGIYGGMLLIPFVHNAAQGATTLHTLDYHSLMVKYPAGSNKVWRDNGVLLRGLLGGDHLDYRVAITRGVAKAADKTLDPSDHVVPRFSGRFAVNLFDAEDTFFLGGTYLGAKKVVSFGVAFDTQPSAFGDGYHYYAFGADAFIDLPLRHKLRLSGQMDFVYYGGEKNPDRGIGFFGDLGLAIGKWEPLISWDYFRPTGSDDLVQQIFGVHAGCNWWMLDHAFNLKLDIGLVKNKGVEASKIALINTLQAQLFF
jgi:hypothetical protein